MYAQRTKDWFKPSERKFELFCFAFFQVIHNCVSAHSNSFSEAFPDIQCTIKAQHTIYDCPCDMDNDHHYGTSSGNNQEWKIKCRKFTKCCPETATCYRYDLNGTPTNKNCDGVLTIYGNEIPSTFTCKVIGCTQNSNSGKTGRYHKKVVATLNPNSQRILIFCKFLRCIDSKMIALNFVSLQPKNN